MDHRFHRKDVLDLEWSTDGAFLISGSVDNSCIIWDVNKGNKYKYNYIWHAPKMISYFLSLIFLLSHLQVLLFRCWMPIFIMFRVWPGIHCLSMLLPLVLIELAEFMPRSLKQNPKVLRRWITVVNMSSQKQDSNQMMIPRLENGWSSLFFVENECNVTNPLSWFEMQSARHHLFHDETLPSFFRRLAWSPDGSFLLVPAGMDLENFPI